MLACRHYAYCVPYTPRSTLPLNSITTVVVSERINAASEAVAKGILAHELGHSIDFHCFGARRDAKRIIAVFTSSLLC